jgi:hypothetical protein
MRIQIHEKNNGYLVYFEDGQYVFKSTEILEMLMVIGKKILGRNIKIQEN